MRNRIGIFAGAAVFAAGTSSAFAVYWTEVDGKVSAYITNDNNRSFDTAVHEAMFVDQAGTTFRTFNGAVGHLVTVDDLAENTLVGGLGRNRGTRWIGLTNSATYGGTTGGSIPGNTSGLPYPTAGETPASQAGNQRGEGFVWVDGSPVLFQAWGGGEPNGGANEPYAEIRQDHLWNDITANAGVNYAAAGNLRRSVIEFNPTEAPLSKWAVTTYKAQDVQLAGVGVGNLAEARAVIAGTRGPLEPSFNGGVPLTQTRNELNLSDSGNQGFFAGDQQYPGFAGAQDNFVINATGGFVPSVGGVYTFGVNSDDGFRLAITNSGTGIQENFTNFSGQGGTAVNAGALEFAGGRGHSNDVNANAVASYGQINLLAGVQYNFDLVYWEGGGGTAPLEVFYRPGTPTDYAANATGSSLSFSDGGGLYKVLGAAGELVPVSPFNVTTYKLLNQINYPDIDSLADADALIANTFAAPQGDLDPTQPGNNNLTGFTNVVNFLDGGGAGGNFGTNNILENDIPLGAGGMDDFVIRATGLVQISEAGIYTFGANGDDGFRMRLDLDGDGFYETTVLSRDGTGGEINVFGNIALVEGIYGIEYVGYDRSSGFGSELFAALNPTGATIGSFTALDFRLVGDAENGGLRVAQDLLAFAVPEPATAMLGLFGLAALARRRNRSA